MHGTQQWCLEETVHLPRKYYIIDYDNLRGLAQHSILLLPMAEPEIEMHFENTEIWFSLN